ncbi:hypothetical protein ACHAPT_004209 [Fusarium lateritium]
MLPPQFESYVDSQITSQLPFASQEIASTIDSQLDAMDLDPVPLPAAAPAPDPPSLKPHLSGPEQEEWDRKCLEYFKEKYKERVNTGWASGPSWNSSRSRPIWEDGVPTELAPLQHGLQLYLVEKEQGFLTRLVSRSLDLLPNLPQNGMDTSTPLEDALDGLLVTLIHDTAGTGKTRAVLDKFCQQTGFYFLAPNLKPSTPVLRRSTMPRLHHLGGLGHRGRNLLKGKTQNTLLDPGRATGSRDTYTAYQDLAAAYDIGFDRLPWDNRLNGRIQEYARRLIIARLKIYNMFLSRVQTGQIGLNKRWTQFQISCSAGNDPFDAAYRFYRLMLAPELNRFDGLALCIDEAQYTLGDPIAKALLQYMLYFTSSGFRMRKYLTGTSLKLKEVSNFVRHQGFDVVLHAANLQYVRERADFNKYLRGHAWGILGELYAVHQKSQQSKPAHLMYNGLSIKLTSNPRFSTTDILGVDDEMIPVLERLEPEHHPLLARGGKHLGLCLNFPSSVTSLRTWDDARGALRESLVIFRFPKLVEAEYLTFQGRIRWTTIFAERLLQMSLQQKGQSDDEEQARKCIAEARELAVWEIKDSLKERIKGIKDFEWAKELFWTAIHADIFGTTRIFASSDCSQSISQGFALVEEVDNHRDGNVVRGKLAEPIVVEAIMEHLRDQGELYDRLLQRFFSNLQVDNVDQGAQGKVAEYVFAPKLSHFLGSPSNPPDAIQRSRRACFMNCLREAKKIIGSTTQTLGDVIDNVDDYELDRPQGPQKLDVQGSIEKFLNQGQQNDPDRPTFLFPSKAEGPDLVFFLKNNGHEKMACVVQFKTGKPEPGQPKAVFEAIRKLSVGEWDKCPVVHIYVANMVKIKQATRNLVLEEAAKPTDRFSGKKNERPEPVSLEYVSFIDEQDSDGIWGVSFQRLLQEMKKKVQVDNETKDEEMQVDGG